MSLIVSPRPYQRQAVDKWRDLVGAGVTRGIITIATGCGKTIAGIISAHEIGTTVFVTPRTELVAQAVRDAREVWPSCRIGVVQGKTDSFDAESNFIVASAQTVCLNNGARFAKILSKCPIKQIIIDEAHHSAAKSYDAILRLAGKIPVLGLTATPTRSDRKGLAPIYGSTPVFSLPLRQAIDQGWLAEIDARHLQVPELNLENIGIDPKSNDYSLTDQQKELVRARVAEKISAALYKLTLESGARTLAFCASIDQAQRMAEYSNEVNDKAMGFKGMFAAFVHGDMPKSQIRDIVSAFQRGHFRVLYNSMLFIEGYNDPSLECVAILRFVKSELLHEQMVGRVTRKPAGKTVGVVYDLVDGRGRHGRTATTLLQEGIEKTGKKGPPPKTFVIGETDGELQNLISLVKSYETGRKPSAEPPRKTAASWTLIAPGIYLMWSPDANRGTLILMREGPEKWRGYAMPKTALSPKGNMSPVMSSHANLELATGIVNDIAREGGFFVLTKDQLKARDEDAGAALIDDFNKIFPKDRVVSGKVGELEDKLNAAMVLRILKRTAIGQPKSFVEMAAAAASEDVDYKPYL